MRIARAFRRESPISNRGGDFVSKPAPDQSRVQVAGAVLGARGDGLPTAGTAGAVAGFLRAVPALKARGRWPLVSEDDAPIAALADTGLTLWAQARRSRPDRAAWPVLISLWQTPSTLRRARSAPSRVLDGRLEPAPAALRAGLLWRQMSGRW